jgi:hypothetical protein
MVGCALIAGASLALTRCGRGDEDGVSGVSGDESPAGELDYAPESLSISECIESR